MAKLNRRRLIAGGASALAGLALSPASALASQTCSVTAGTRKCRSRLRHSLSSQSTRRQNRSEWCWAASLSMIFSYYGHPISQERIVREAWGQVANVPRHVDDVMRDINRVWKDDNGESFRVSGQRLTLHHIDLPIRAAKALEQNKPLIVGALGHATVLTEMRWQVGPDGDLFVTDIIVNDPSDGSRRNLSFEERLGTVFVAAVDVHPQ